MTLTCFGVKFSMSIWQAFRRIESELVEVSLLVEMNAEFLFYYSTDLFSFWFILVLFDLFGMSQ